MRKFKRNIILIFGFILVVNSLFFPCNQIEYFIGFSNEQETKVEAKRWVVDDYFKVFFPLIKSRANKYKEYVKWESSALLKLDKEIKALENKLFKTPIKTEPYKEVYAAIARKSIFRRKVREIYEKEYEEFKKKFGYDHYYHQIRTEGFFIEPVLLFLIGGIILVGVKKIRAALRKTREKGVNRIKRRKTGVVLSLIGVGVLAVYLPFGTSIADEGVITLFSIAGITLFLVGMGLVIFSFFPDDANPKK